MVIKIKQLQELLLRTNKHLEEYYGDEIVINNDYYNTVHTNLFDIEKEQTPAVGSLLDDWESVQLLLQDKERPFTSVDLDRLAAIFNAISETTNPIN